MSSWPTPKPSPSSISVPISPAKPGALDRTAQELRFALTEIGFYFIVNHGVPREKIRAVFEQVKRFHAQPVEKKLALKLDRHNTGYLPMRGNTLRTSTVQAGTKPNLNEAFFVKRELPPDHPDVLADRRFRGPNRWPDDLPGLPRDDRRLLRDAGAAGAEDGAALRPRPRPAGAIFRRAVPATRNTRCA